MLTRFPWSHNKWTVTGHVLDGNQMFTVRRKQAESKSTDRWWAKVVLARAKIFSSLFSKKFDQKLRRHDKTTGWTGRTGTLYVGVFGQTTRANLRVIQIPCSTRCHSSDNTTHRAFGPSREYIISLPSMRFESGHTAWKNQAICTQFCTRLHVF